MPKESENEMNEPKDKDVAMGDFTFRLPLRLMADFDMAVQDWNSYCKCGEIHTHDHLVKMIMTTEVQRYLMRKATNYDGL